MFSAMLSLCRSGDYVMFFLSLHGNDSGGSVGLLFSDFLRFLFYFIYLFFILFFFSPKRPTRNRETHSTISEKKEGGLTSFIDAWNFFDGHFEFCGQLLHGLELIKKYQGYGDGVWDSRKTLERSERLPSNHAYSRRSDRGDGAALHYPNPWKRLVE